MKKKEAPMKDEVNKKMAELMEYTTIDRLHVKDKLGNYVYDGTEFNPYENIAQAFECLAEFRKTRKNRRWQNCSLISPRPNYFKLVNSINANDWRDLEENPATAITKALCLALEGGE